jgi:hypothetical protein
LNIITDNIYSPELPPSTPLSPPNYKTPNHERGVRGTTLLVKLQQIYNNQLVTGRRTNKGSGGRNNKQQNIAEYETNK